jgi:hypothetical protein
MISSVATVRLETMSPITLLYSVSDPNAKLHYTIFGIEAENQQSYVITYTVLYLSNTRLHVWSPYGVAMEARISTRN